MKIIRYLGIGIFISLQTACYTDNDDYTDHTPSSYLPVLMSRTDFENSVAITTPRAVETAGKIYVKENILLVNEMRQGFHVYDNTNPESPKSIAFITAPGATDIAIRDNMLYINQATDLLAVQYDATTNKLTVTKRVPNTFPPLRSPEGYIPITEEVVTNWTLKNN